MNMMLISRKSMLVISSLLILSGCATTPDQCQSRDGSASLLTKMSCDYSGSYGAEVRQHEQELLDAKAENEMFRQVYQDIVAQQEKTKLSLGEQRQQQQQLDKSLGQLLQQLKGRHANKSQVQQRIAVLENEMAEVRNQNPGNSPAAVAKKQAELKALQQQVSRLQLSLGY